MNSENLYNRIKLTIDIINNDSYTEIEKTNHFRSTLRVLGDLDEEHYELVQSMLTWTEEGTYEYSKLLLLIILKELNSIYGKSVPVDGGWI